ncbi:hypothetical protein B0H14DRAFT_3904371 [Mycena olivaceomarginata]|nr:hypothetical protein B0H14DRAFT_3904371 [Mycena olivaceomarginata]
MSTGFIVSQAQMTAYLPRHMRRREGPLFALKWRISDYNYELIPIKYGDLTGTHIFARLCSWPREGRDALWYEAFGKHGGVALEECEMFTMRYPTNGAVADFLAAELEAAVTRNRELWKFLVPFTPATHFNDFRP